MKPVATGNWGCGGNGRGDVQLKMVIQWMAASVAGLPVLVYYTAGHERLAKVTFIILNKNQGALGFFGSSDGLIDKSS